MYKCLRLFNLIYRESKAMNEVLDKRRGNVNNITIKRYRLKLENLCSHTTVIKKLHTIQFFD